MGLDINKSWILIKSLVDHTAEINGVFTILWHNSYLFDEQLALYMKKRLII